jgi:hypothetical protein
VVACHHRPALGHALVRPVDDVVVPPPGLNMARSAATLANSTTTAASMKTSMVMMGLAATRPGIIRKK